MSKIAYSKLKIKPDYQTIAVPVCNDVTLEVRTYLPQDEKVEFISFVVLNSIDYDTGTFSPLRIDTFFGIALAKYYANITFTDKQLAEVGKIYDALNTNGIFDAIICAIDENEYRNLYRWVEKTTADIARYNNSVMGILQNVNRDQNELTNQLDDVLNKLKDNEGLDTVAQVIKNY